MAEELLIMVEEWRLGTAGNLNRARIWLWWKNEDCINPSHSHRKDEHDDDVGDYRNLSYGHLNSLSTKFPRCNICQAKAAFIFCVKDRDLICRDCDESIKVANSRSANDQRFLAIGIIVALTSSSCSQETEKNQFEPSNNQQKSKEIPAKTTSQQQPSSATPFLWAVDDFFQFTDPEFTDKKKTA